MNVLRRVGAAIAVLAIVATTSPACSQGEGGGKIVGVLNAPDCWTGAFELNADLKGPGVTADDVMKATAYLIPSLEVVDSRIRDWKIKIFDTIADNASCARFVLGKSRTKPDGINLKLVGMNFHVDGNLDALVRLQRQRWGQPARRPRRRAGPRARNAGPVHARF